MKYSVHSPRWSWFWLPYTIGHRLRLAVPGWKNSRYGNGNDEERKRGEKGRDKGLFSRHFSMEIWVNEGAKVTEQDEYWVSDGIPWWKINERSSYTTSSVKVSTAEMKFSQPLVLCAHFFRDYWKEECRGNDFMDAEMIPSGLKHQLRDLWNGEKTR